VAIGLAGCKAAVPSPRAAVVARVADLVKVTNPEGIDTLEQIPIGDTRQWISIRGRDRSNPILLFIHGGPGNPTMPSSWAFQKPWEDYFTVVQWDQRGTGKSAFPPSERDRFAPTMTLQQFVEDGLAVIDHLRRQLGQEKVIVMGWSWGTAVGARMALRAPDRIHAFVGMGQVVAVKWERIVYDRTLALARQAGNDSAVRELEGLAPYPGPNNEGLMAGVGMVRKWARAFNGGWYGRKDLALYNALPQWAPEYTDADLAAQDGAGDWALPLLLADAVRHDLAEEGLEYQVPVVFLMGRHDLHTPIEPVEEYFQRIQAPAKRLVIFDKSGHFLMFEEPGRLLVTLVEDVLPFAPGKGQPVERVR
jgi:pimeloyl-ACP methyl ester carboxylesterase